ncbi:phosphomannomutase/phosphoglucomutase [Actinospica robiniae]|uniref:phosphomannomutase/phosphoglucomutase n=1 Tax=Actinospica robiniae TaxID=304901 RepID=UPI00041CEAD1|nr:phosphomannomutase/phosphoglucomutase [Actinospica robiniae]
MTAPHPTAGDLTHVVKAYDIRALVPEQLDETIATALGAAFVRVVGAEAITIGWDMRPSSPTLADAFARGAAAQGADVVKIGLASTDELYFASGHLDLPGAMFTASHNPAKYNGIKMCRAGAAPVGQDTGLEDIRALAARELAAPGTVLVPAEKQGSITERDLLTAYAAHLRSLVDLTEIRPLKVVVDAANGMGGHTVPTVFHGLPLDLVPMYFELDGTFPNHEANPLDPKNLVDLQAKVTETGADLGLAFDGDADRCFIVDERGEPVSPSAITALVATRELAKHPGATVIHNLITSQAVPEIVREHGGVPVRTRVGHSFIKQEMAVTGAVFGGEHSAHYYFADFWKADTGMLAAMHVLAALGGQEQPLSELTAVFERYHASGEINSQVADQAGRTAAVRSAFADRPGVSIDDLDGMTVAGDGWWFNLRPSNTEPLLRLNIEARSTDEVAAVRDEVLAIVRLPEA